MKTKIILGILLVSVLSSLFFYVKSLQSENERLESELLSVINANLSLEKALNESLKRHEKELQALKDLKQDENELKEKVIKVKEYVYKSSENNLTKLFNSVLSSLFEDSKHHAN